MGAVARWESRRPCAPVFVTTDVHAVTGQLVVVLTDVGEDELGLEALRAGAVEVVPKDADIDVLARALEGARREDAAISRAAG